MAEVTIQIPDWVDPSCIQRIVDDRLAEHLADKARAEARDHELRENIEALQDDSTLAAWLARNKITEPTVRASAYDDVSAYQEIGRFNNDPRRPVVMRSAIRCLIQRHTNSSSGCANGWAIMVAERYLKLIKYTCIDDNENRNNIRDLGHRLGKRYNVSYHFYNWLADDFHLNTRQSRIAGLKEVWMRGKIVALTAHQIAYLSKLDEILRKTDRLDRQIAQHRLAA